MMMDVAESEMFKSFVALNQALMFFITLNKTAVHVASMNAYTTFEDLRTTLICKLKSLNLSLLKTPQVVTTYISSLAGSGEFKKILAVELIPALRFIPPFSGCVARYKERRQTIIGKQNR